jgi:hypothetical protein
MNRFRVLMILTTLLASAATASAQSLSAATWQAWQAASQRQTCEETPMWLTGAIQDGFAAVRKLRVMCADHAVSKKSCCDIEVVRPGTVKPATSVEVDLSFKDILIKVGEVRGGTSTPNCPAQGCGTAQLKETRTGSLMLGAGINSDSGICGAMGICPVQACSGLRDFVKFACPVQFRVFTTTPAPCCCAKACACCESCKAAKPAVRMMPAAVAPFPSVWSGPVPPPMPMPPQAAPWPVRHPMQMAPGTVVSLPTTAPIKIARLVTPDFEAHCEKMTHKGDTIVLEGNVMFLSKKHANPLRVEAHRIVVNMKDGSFMVDSEVRPMPTVGHLRLPLTEEMLQRIQIVMPTPTVVEQALPNPRSQLTPSSHYREAAPDRIIQIVPVPTYEARPATPK